MPGSKGRRFGASIETHLPCELIGPGASGRGELVSFALGEVVLALTAGSALEGDPVKLRVELPGEELELDGIVSRVSAAAAGAVRCGVRLSEKEDGERTAELELLERLLQAPETRRRQAPRVSRRVAVTCIADEQFEAEIVDLSRAGLALEGRLPLKEGDSVTVRIEPQRQPHAMQLTGRVVYLRRLSDTELRAGVRFEGLADREQKALAEYLRVLVRRG